MELHKVKATTKNERFREFLSQCLQEFKNEFTARELRIFFLKYHEGIGRRKMLKYGLKDREIRKFYKKIKEPYETIQYVQSEFAID